VAVEFKCLSNHEIPLVIRSLNNEPLQEEDKIFLFEGMCAKLIDIPDIYISKNRPMEEGAELLGDVEM